MGNNPSCVRVKKRRNRAGKGEQPGALSAPVPPDVYLPAITPQIPVARPEPTVHTVPGQHSPPYAQGVDVPFNGRTSVVPASTAVQDYGENRSPPGTLPEVTSEVSTTVAYQQGQEATTAPSLSEMLRAAQALGEGIIGTCAKNVNDYGNTLTVVQQGAAGSTIVGTIADDVKTHEGSKQIEVVVPATGPGPQGFAAVTVAEGVERRGTASTSVGWRGDLQNSDTGSYPNELETMGGPNVSASKPSFPLEPSGTDPRKMVGHVQLPTTQTICTPSGLESNVIQMAHEIGACVSAGGVVLNQIIKGYQNDVVGQVRTGETAVLRVNDQITIEAGALHRLVMLPGEDEHHRGKTIGLMANTIVNNGVGVSVMGDEKAQRIAEEYAQKDLATWREMFNRNAPDVKSGVGSEHKNYTSPMPGNGPSAGGMSGPNPCFDTRDRRMRPYTGDVPNRVTQFTGY